MKKYGLKKKPEKKLKKKTEKNPEDLINFEKIWWKICGVTQMTYVTYLNLTPKLA